MINVTLDTIGLRDAPEIAHRAIASHDSWMPDPHSSR